MPDFLLRDLPEELMAALRQRAQRNARSLQTEMREALQASVPMPRDQWLAEAAALRARTKRGGETAAESIRRGHEERDAAIDRALRGDYDDPGRP
jgi:plasmid stability protein